MPKEVTKVKRLHEKTTVLWTVPNGSHVEGGSLEECPDVPSSEFLGALAKVEVDLMAKAKARITFKAKGDGSSLTLTGVSMTRNNAGRRQYKPSAIVDLGWGTTGVSLPLLLEPDAESDSGADNVLTDGEHKHLRELFALALKYAEGERHQATLDIEPGEEEKRAA